METARCRAVLAAAETGSFSRAAEVLRYTPSGVNQLVTAFENELGFSVFRRSTKGVSLTENGQLLLPTVREFLRQEDRLFELATEINGLLIGSVTIAAYSSIATHWLPAVIRVFQQDYPHVLSGSWRASGRRYPGGWTTARRTSVFSATRRACPMSGSPWRRILCWPCCRRAILWRMHPLIR